jgi:hypothetical protein
MQSNGNKDFLDNLNELMLLFKKLQKKAIKEGIIIKDDMMFKNFELLSDNYNMIKDTIPPELIEEIGEPIKEMIQEMINQLKKELGDEIFEQEQKRVKSELGIDVSDNQEQPIILESKDTVTSELEKIDEALSQDNLTEEELNTLLDKRAKLKK